MQHLLSSRRRRVAVALLAFAAMLCAALPAQAGRPRRGKANRRCARMGADVFNLRKSAQSAVFSADSFAFVPLVFYRWEGAPAPLAAGSLGQDRQDGQDGNSISAHPVNPVHPVENLPVSRRCAKCHAGDAPAGGLDLTTPLSETQRLACIARMLEDDPERRMPKGAALPAEELGRLIQYFSKMGTEP